MSDQVVTTTNERFTVAARNELDGHRSIEGMDLAAILCQKETRRLANDYTVSWHGRQYQLPKAAVKPGLRGRTIEIQQRLDGAMMARLNGTVVPLARCGAGVEPIEPEQPKPSSKRYVPKPGHSRWMDGFRLSPPRGPAGPAIPNSAQLRSPSGLPPPG